MVPVRWSLKRISSCSCRGGGAGDFVLSYLTVFSVGFSYFAFYFVVFSYFACNFGFGFGHFTASFFVFSLLFCRIFGFGSGLSVSYLDVFSVCISYFMVSVTPSFSYSRFQMLSKLRGKQSDHSHKKRECLLIRQLCSQYQQNSFSFQFAYLKIESDSNPRR